MPEWLKLEDPLVQKFVYGAAAFIVLVLVVRFWQRRREAAAAARRRSELRQTYSQLQLQQREIEQLARRIIATSSTATIAGFEIVRQIEAVFTDGHRSPTEAAEVLKALAARKGANALVNLAGTRLPSGKCAASGDAVVVRPRDVPPADQSAAEQPG